MKAILLSLLFVVLCSAYSEDEKKIVCYFGSWAVYRHGNGQFMIPYIDPNLCTHLIYTFTGLSYDGVIKSLDPYADLPDNYGKNGFGEVNKLRERNSKLKTLIAMGGWNEGSQKYSEAVKTPQSRSRLANSIVQFVKRYQFDGFDLDWEYPNQRGGVPEDKKNFILLLQELKDKLSRERLLLSVAVGAAEHSASQSYYIAELARTVDFINLMTYDYHGASWESILGIVAPLYASPDEKEYRSLLNVNASVYYWLQRGVPAQKLILGVPFYGQSFTLENRNNTKPGSLSAGPGNPGPYTMQAGNLAYMELCEMFRQDEWTHQFEEHQMVPYSYRKSQWVGYDNIQSLTVKANYIKALNLGGVMIWSIESDDFRGLCGDKYPLLKTLNHVLRGGDKPVTKPPPEFTTEEPNITSTTTEEPSPADVICTQDGYVRDRKDCSKFYYCQSYGDGSRFRVHEFHCPAGLYFNTQTNNCDYPANTDCTMNVSSFIL